MKTYRSHAGMNRTKRIFIALGLAAAVMFPRLDAQAAQAPVNLGTAGNYAILTKSGISTVPASAVTGDIGVSPIDSTAITGFSLILDGTTRFATAPQVTGRVYAADYASPTPSILTTAISDMETAFTDAAGRTLPDFTELGAGNIGGLTLVPGLYKWGTGVNIPTDITIAGGPNEVWIFQIAGDLTIAGAKSVLLSGGAQAANIFWQVSGGVGVDLGTTSHFEGIIMAEKAINLQTGASINGRLLAQTAVTLDANTVTSPNPVIGTITLESAAELMGPYTRASGQSLNTGTKTITVPMSGGTQFYRIMSDTAMTITSSAVLGGNVLIDYR
jgi:Ice-binding-like